MGQGPCDVVVGGADQHILQHIGLSLGEGLVAGVGVIDDGAGGIDQIGVLLESVHQVLLVVGRSLSHPGDVGVVVCVVGIVVVENLLAQEVDGIAEVGAPAVDDKALELGSADLLRQAGNEGLDVQLDEVVAEAVGEALLQDGGVVQCGGAAGDDEVGGLDGEGDADGAQLLHGLLLQGGDVAAVGTQADHGLAVVLLSVEAHLLGHQSGVLSALRVVAQTLHGVVVVLALQGIDLVVAGEPCLQVQAAVEALTESGVGDGLVPVHIGGAVGVVLLVVEVHGVGSGAGALLTELAVVLVVGVGGDGGDGALVQVHLVQLAVLVELECDGLIGDHGHGQTLEAADVGSIVVVGVGNIALGVALDILFDDIGAAVPHVGVVAATEGLDAQLVDQRLRGGVEAGVGGHGIKVGAGVLAGEHQSVVVGSLDAHACVQHILIAQVGGGSAHILGLLVVLLSAHDVQGGHGGVVGLVLGGVQHPLQTDQKIGGGDVLLHLAVAVHPVHIVAQVEGPDGGVLVGLPAGGDGGHQLAVAVEAHQAVPQVGDDVGVGEGLAVQHVPALDLTVGRLPGDVLLEGGGTGGVGGLCAGSSRAAGVVGLAAAAGGQQAGGTHDAGALQEAAAGDVAGLKIDVH